MVARLCRTLSHQLRGWKRSSGTMQPPLRIIAMVEKAIAFMCTIGSGVISRSAPGWIVASPPTSRYHWPARRK